MEVRGERQARTPASKADAPPADTAERELSGRARARRLTWITSDQFGSDPSESRVPLCHCCGSMTGEKNGEIGLVGAPCRYFPFQQQNKKTREREEEKKGCFFDLLSRNSSALAVGLLFGGNGTRARSHGIRKATWLFLTFLVCEVEKGMKR